jgi:hypothetical protein
MIKLSAFLVLAATFAAPLHAAEPISCDEPTNQASDKDQIAAVQKALLNLKEPWQAVPEPDKTSDAYKADPQKADADRSAAIYQWTRENTFKKESGVRGELPCSNDGHQITLPNGETIDKPLTIDIYLKGKKTLTVDPIQYHYLMVDGKVNNGMLKFLAGILIGDGSQSAAGKAP